MCSYFTIRRTPIDSNFTRRNVFTHNVRNYSAFIINNSLLSYVIWVPANGEIHKWSIGCYELSLLYRLNS